LIRRELTDAQWLRIEWLCAGKAGDKGRHGDDNRLFVDAVLWIARAGAPWRDLPPAFGGWNSVFRRFRRWAKTGVWERIFNALMEDPDFEYLIIDSTIVRAHQHAAGAKKGGARMRRSGVHAAA
jgi:transposase